MDLQRSRATGGGGGGGWCGVRESASCWKQILFLFLFCWRYTSLHTKSFSLDKDASRFVIFNWSRRDDDFAPENTWQCQQTFQVDPADRCSWLPGHAGQDSSGYSTVHKAAHTVKKCLAQKVTSAQSESPALNLDNFQQILRTKEPVKGCQNMQWAKSSLWKILGQVICFFFTN